MEEIQKLLPEKPRKLESYTSTEYGLFVEDNLNKQIVEKIEPKTNEPRVLTVMVGGDDIGDKGYAFFMIGTQPFRILYASYSDWQRYTRNEYTLWFGDLKLTLDSTPDEVGLPDEARVVAKGKHAWMNMDSSIVVVRLAGIFNCPERLRLTLTKEEEMTSVYQRVSAITGLGLRTLRIGVKGSVIGPQGRVCDTPLRNEDDLWWMDYPTDLHFPW